MHNQRLGLKGMVFSTLVLSALTLTSCGSEPPTAKTEPSIAPTAKPSAMASASPSASPSSKMTPGNAMGMKPNAEGKCAADEPIKGNLTKKKNKIYHEPGSSNYEQVKPEECFKTAADAEKAGYHALKTNTMSKGAETKTKN
jgi:hypothetical protein